MPILSQEHILLAEDGHIIVYAILSNLETLTYTMTKDESEPLKWSATIREIEVPENDQALGLFYDEYVWAKIISSNDLAGNQFDSLEHGSDFENFLFF